MSVSFRPKLFDALEGYTRRDLTADLTAGLTVGIVALPLAMAFAIASGVSPEAGIFTAVIGGFLVSLLGGSRVQIGGPTGAFVAIVFATITDYGLENLYIATILAGLLLIVMGFTGMGTMIKFIPFPITTGFTSGIAVLILTSQTRDLLGLRMEQVPADFIERMTAFTRHLPSTDWTAAALALGSLLVILLWPERWARRVPGTIVALLSCTVVVAAFKVPVETIGSRFGGIPQGIPPLRVPQVTWQTLHDLFRPALTIALLAAIESLLSAVVADGLIEDRHDSNQELMAPGIANVAVPLFGGIPATGAIARTPTNIKSGGRTPVAGMVHAVVLLGIILMAAPLARHVPLAALSAVLVVVSLRMGEWHHFRRLRRWPKSDAAVFLSSFGLTVLVDLTVAVEIGMVLAAVLFVKRVSETTEISLIAEDAETPWTSLKGKKIPEGVLVFRMFGALFFGAADKLETVLKRASQEPDVLILRLSHVHSIDATGLNALENILEKLQAGGKHLVLSGAHAQPLRAMERAGLVERIGEANLCPNVDSALARASLLLEKD